MNNYKIKTKTKDITFISYYTFDSPYVDIAKKYLIPSLEKFKLKYDITGIKSFGSWYKNTAYKGKFILDKLKQYSIVVWLDVDAEIKSYPNLFFNIPDEYNLAVHYLEWASWYGYKNNPTKELLTGTMFLKYNNNIANLCREWYELSFNTTEWEQKVLQRILPKYNIKVYKLPLDYSYINSLPDGRDPLVKIDNPIIVHHQISRDLKRKIK